MIPIDDVLSALAGLTGMADANSVDSQVATILAKIRIPRLVLGIIVGAGLAISGCVMQALFRNPMADPGLLGVSSGAALGAMITIVLGARIASGLPAGLVEHLIPVVAFAGGLCALAIIHRLSRINFRIDIPTMLLAGIALNSITGALIGLVSYISDDGQLRQLVFWGLGSLEVTNWTRIGISAAVIVPASVVMTCYARHLNANLLGENEARYLGIDIEGMKKMLVVLVSLIVGACVAMSGIIGFVGLLVPHLVRMATGPDHRLLLPACGIFGAVLLVLADILARTLITPAEIPIGIITAILGGPFFLWLLVRHRRKLAL
ncbi:MAG: iron ABC transporter permease [Gammaproteobacteria bacterium]|nr:iron ABC transporter permease [Gammaproteobacteria bacterium]